MKKYLFLAIIFLLYQPVFAEDCMHDPIYDTDWNAEVTTGVRVRDIPCMETSNVITTIPVGEVIHVVAETDGYYKIERKDGITGWIGQWLVKTTDRPFNHTPKSGGYLFDIAGSPFETAIRYLSDNKIISGYSDGSFKPNDSVNRAEFVKIIVGSVYGYDPQKDPSGTDIYSGAGFSDTSDGEWYIPYLRKAVSNNIIDGYPDGTFRPGDKINFAEASKILVNSMKVKSASCENCLWYEKYIKALQNQSYIPDTIKSADHFVSRGEMSELIWRIKESVNYKTFSQIL